MNLLFFDSNSDKFETDQAQSEFLVFHILITNKARALEKEF